ncbi:cAMP-binding domain of CRP or a regulatory subunit of cAMP-dependent protein kinases [Pedobacter westerhofensis]|uniref:cAMP-binding domain of CRP or a regulatory subunit of cAMP-dependent protein kinases n=1 Tax=Pedobacter westerhofensis TaxID=425512 RepID=A0A521F4Z9_9SPHI|nr:Crp/Fnr family transcriptional regulator [Pedobacter westerhofensis]SMO91248.1 cAMP-binding domain of CRP or a regulatory subunit of cAMP-dependent protein kinases [Pedobacter westerhofensis]
MENFKAFINAISPISDTDFNLIAPYLVNIRLKKRENILEQGEICRHLYFLKKGLLRMFYLDQDGNEINCRFVDENHFFVDFSSFLTQTPSKYFWQALQDSEFFALKHADVNTLYAKCPAWEHLGRLVAENVYQTANERIEMLLFLSPEERYQYLLNRSPQLFNQVSQFHIASYLGVKPESLSRLRKRLLRR